VRSMEDGNFRLDAPATNPSAAAGDNFCGRPPRADEGNADGSRGGFQEGTTDSAVTEN